MRKFTGGALAIAGLLALTACGGNVQPAGGDGTDGEAVTIKVGVIPVATTTSLRLGVEKGFFEDEGLNVELQEGQSGSAITASVLSGEAQIGFASAVPLLQAQLRGVPVQIVGPGGSTANHKESVMVASGSAIQDIEDLEGKTVGVVALGAIDELATRTAVREGGGDDSKLKLVSIPFADMPSSLEKGIVDAVVVLDPFYTALVGKGARAIIPEPMQDMLGSDGMTSAYFASKDYLGKNADVLDRFHRALVKSNKYANEHPDEVVEMLPKFTNITSEVAGSLTPAKYSTTVNMDSLERMSKLMVEFSFVDKAPSPDALVARLAR